MAPLHVASEANDLQAVLALVECGEDVNVRTRNQNRTPLHVAVASGAKEVGSYRCQWLLGSFQVIPDALGGVLR